MPTKALLTADDLERMPQDDAVRVELDRGELITMPPAGGEHGEIGSEVARILSNHIRAHKLGRYFNSDTGFRLSPDTVRAPDFAFIRSDRAPKGRTLGFVPVAPDLAVEVFSPSDSPAQLMRKIKQYLAAGTHTVWVIYPEQKQVHVIEAAGADRILNAPDMLDCPELLPGFSVLVESLFT
jgi:Uma2 family endonuclease